MYTWCVIDVIDDSIEFLILTMCSRLGYRCRKIDIEQYLTKNHIAHLDSIEKTPGI